MEGYNFDKGKHLHSLDGKPLIGVTTALSVIAKPMLIQWAANMAVDYIEAHDPQMGVSAEVLKEARTAHRRKKEEAGQKGTDVHAEVEKLVMEQIGTNNGKFTEDLKSDIPQVQNFINWARENDVEFLESEKNVYSKELWIGGILDLVFKMGGKKYIGDVKTSSGIYNEHFFQMAAYELCLNEMGVNDIDGYLVINLKKDGTMDLKVAENRDTNKEAFKHALGLHKIINSLI